MTIYETGQTDLPLVTDWVNDWDWLDPQWGPNAIEIWDQVREVCPVATTERYGRAFMPVTYEAVAQVAHAPRTSRRSGSASHGPTRRVHPHRRSPRILPITTSTAGCCCRRSAPR